MKKLYPYLKSKDFLWGLLSPICLVILLNIGLILNLPNICVDISDIVKFLSSTLTNTYSIQLLSLIITITVLFFAFVQFSFSLSTNEIPGKFKQRYILQSSTTKFYVGFQFSLVVVFSSFVVIGTQIHVFNLVISLILLLFSFALTFKYFYWVITFSDSTTLIEGIINNVRFKEFEILDKTIIGNMSRFKKELSNNKLNNYIITNPHFNFFLYSDNTKFYFKSAKTGLVKEIQIKEIFDILKDYMDSINKIELGVFVGNLIKPIEDFENITREHNILVIHLKSLTEIERRKFFKSLNSEVLKSKVENCFIIEEDQNLSNTEKQIDEIVSLYRSSVSAKNEELALKIVDKLTTLFRNNFYSSKTKSVSNDFWVLETIFVQLINSISRVIFKSDSREFDFTSLFSLLYAVKNYAIAKRSYQLLNEIHLLYSHISYQKIYMNKVYEPQILSLVLRIQEISFSSLVYGEPQLTYKELLHDWNTFFAKIIARSLEQSISILRIILQSMIKKKDFVNIEYLSKNTQQYINLMTIFDMWQPIEQFREKYPNVYQKFRRSILYSQAQDMIYFSAYIFKNFCEKRVPAQIFVDIGLPLCEYCNTFAKYDIQTVEILSYYFYDINFVWPESVWGEEFEVSIIHESGGYSPSYYNFQNFWFTIYLFFIHRHGINFIRKPENSYERSRLETFISYIDKSFLGGSIINSEIHQIFNFEKRRYKKYFYELRKHIED